MKKLQPVKATPPAPPRPEPNCHGNPLNGEPRLDQRVKAIFSATNNLQQP